MQTLSALELHSKKSCQPSAPRPEKGTHFGVKVSPCIPLLQNNPSGARMSGPLLSSFPHSQFT